MSNIYGVRLDWTNFKIHLDAGHPFKEIPLPGSIRLIIVDGDSKLQTVIHTDGDMSTEYTDYTDNYAANKNKPVNMKNSDGLSLVAVDHQPAFADKVTPDGKKLYRRKHGVCKNVVAGTSDTLSIVVPYNLAKINTIEIINCATGDLADLKVYDTPTGTISTVPDYMLNQFGFDVCLPDGFYKDESNYDADVIKDMKIELTYKNNGVSDRMIGINLTLHELIE